MTQGDACLRDDIVDRDRARISLQWHLARRLYVLLEFLLAIVASALGKTCLGLSELCVRILSLLFVLLLSVLLLVTSRRGVALAVERTQYGVATTESHRVESFLGVHILVIYYNVQGPQNSSHKSKDADQTHSLNRLK